MGGKSVGSKAQTCNPQRSQYIDCTIQAPHPININTKYINGGF